jgi:hypothetical protein
MKTPKRIETPKRVEGNEMPSRPMSAEPPHPAAGGRTPSSQKGEMPSRAMDEPAEPSNSPNAVSPREQGKLAAYRRDQTARAAAGKDEMPTGT